MAREKKYTDKMYREDKALIFEALRALREGDQAGCDAALKRLHPIDQSEDDPIGGTTL